MEEVSDWLTANGLGEYIQEFMDNGWDELSLLLDMTDSDINICISKRGHRVKFKKARRSLPIDKSADCNTPVAKDRDGRVLYTKSLCSVPSEGTNLQTCSTTDTDRSSETLATSSALKLDTADDLLDTSAASSEVRMESPTLNTDSDKKAENERSDCGVPAAFSALKLGSGNKQLEINRGTNETFTKSTVAHKHYSGDELLDTNSCASELAIMTGKLDNGGEQLVVAKETVDEEIISTEEQGSTMKTVLQNEKDETAEEFENTLDDDIESYLSEPDREDTIDDVSASSVGLELASMPYLSDNNLTLLSDEDDRPLQPLTSFSTVGQCSSSPVGGGQVNLTIIKHSAHTTVAGSSAQMIGKNHDEPDPLKNLKDQMEMIADAFKKKDHLFVETRAYDELKLLLEAEYWAMLLGKPGDGKSTTAAHLLLQYRDKGYEPIFVTSVQDWKTLISRKSGKQIVVIDDMFGSTSVENKKAERWMSMIENMKKISEERKGDLLVVCTSRKYIFKDVESALAKFACFAKSMIVDMTNKNNELSCKEKIAIFTRYADEYDIEKSSLISGIQRVNPPHGFPHCVALYCTDSFLRQNGLYFFTNPVKCIQKEIYNFKDNDRVKFLVLLLVLHKNNNLKATYFDALMDNATDDEKKMFKTTGVSLETAIPDIQKAMEGLTNTYLTRNSDGSFSFTHHSLRENLAFVYISANPCHATQILAFNDILVLSKNLNDNTCSLGDTSKIVRLPLNQLAKRISFEIRNGNVLSACRCKIWHDQIFVSEWLKYIECEPYASLEMTLCACEKGSFDKRYFSLLTYLIRNNHKSALEALFRSRVAKDTIQKSLVWQKHFQVGLYVACADNKKEDNSDLIKDLISFTFESTGQLLDGSEALQACLISSKSECAMVLLQETSICPDYTRLSYDNSYFHLLAGSDIGYSDFKKICNMLLEKGVDLNQGNSANSTPIFYCVHITPFNDKGFKRLLYLIEKGADIHKRCKLGNIVAFTIKMQLREHCLQVIQGLAKLGADFQCVDDNGSNALHILCNQNQGQSLVKLELLDFLLKKNMNYSLQSNGNGEVPLMLALRHNHSVEFVQRLAKHSPPKYKTHSGEGYFHYLFSLKYINKWFCKYCEILLGMGENINLKDNSGNSPIAQLIQAGPFLGSIHQHELFRFLLKNGADLAARDKRGRNVVLRSCEQARTEDLVLLFQLFYSANLDFQLTDQNDRNIMHYVFVRPIKPVEIIINSDGVTYCYLEEKWSVSAEEDAVLSKLYTFLTKQVRVSSFHADKSGINPLMLALQNCAECACVNDLLKGEVPLQQDVNGKSYFHYLAKSRASDATFEFIKETLKGKQLGLNENALENRLPHHEIKLTSP